MKHDPYSLTELIRNDDFIAWVRHPTAGSETHWQNFLFQHPEKRKIVEAARGYVILLAEDTGRNKPSAEQTNKMWRAVESHLHIENTAEIVAKKKIISWKWLRLAASVALMLGIASGSYWYLIKKSGKSTGLGLGTVKSQSDPGLVERLNNTSKPMTILLADGSSVVLHPGGRLGFSALKNLRRREVTLRGKAFFEIVKNPEIPFLVYTDRIVTKVLGTSFLLDAPEHGEEVNVEVRTGKVSVFQIGKNPTEQELEVAGEPEMHGIILNKDEKIAVSRQSGKPVKIQAANIRSADAMQDVSRQLFIFDETPASEVFKALEKVYNIKIIYDESVLKNCPLNATLIGQPFIEKLTVICGALDAHFEMIDNQVIITAKSCK